MSVSKLLSRPAGNCQDALLLLLGGGGGARLLGCAETSRPAVQEQRGPLVVHTTAMLVICYASRFRPIGWSLTFPDGCRGCEGCVSLVYFGVMQH